MSEFSCPVSGSARGRCPAGAARSPGSRASSTRGPRGCAFSGYGQSGDLRTAFDIPHGVDTGEWLRMRERKAINEILYANIPAPAVIDAAKSQPELDAFAANEQDLLAVALGAPARQVMLRAEEIGPRTGWRDGYLTAEHGFCPPDYEEPIGALARSPGRLWSDLCERMPGIVARGRVRETIASLPVIEGTEEVIPDQALWGAVVALGMLCSIYRYEDKNDGQEGVHAVNAKPIRLNCEIAHDLGEELIGLPMCIALPYYQISRRMGRALPHLSFPDQASYNLKIRDPQSTSPYLARFDNTELRWPMFGERHEVAFLKGCADTSASFQHGADAIAACQEHVMNRNVEGLLYEMIRLKQILERMPNAFHSINTNPNSGENYVAANKWVRWGKFSAPLSKRCPAASGLQFPPFLVMDAFLGRKKYSSFLGNEGVHLRAWLPSNHRAFIAAIEYHYRVPEFVMASGDARLMGVLDGIVEAYAGERGFMGVHRYKVFGILEVAAKTGRSETNGVSGAGDDNGRPWEETHKQFSEAMKERLEPYRGTLDMEPHQMRGTFEECRYVSRIVSRRQVDSDPARSISLVTLDLEGTGVTFDPGDRLALMPLNNWDECAKVAAALGLEELVDAELDVEGTWARFERHLASVRRLQLPNGMAPPKLTVRDILRHGHLAPITKDLALKIHEMLHASSNTVLRVLATEEWPVRGSLGDLLQAAVVDTPEAIWDKAFDLNALSWLADLIPVEVPRTYSIASYTGDLLPDTVDLAVSRADYKLCSTFAPHGQEITRSGVASGFLNPPVGPDYEDMPDPDEEVLIGISRPVAFQLPIDQMAPCAFFAGGSGIAPFRSFWQSRLVNNGLSGGRNILYLGVQSREKFCFEEELRDYVDAGFMEVHTAFSRDNRGLVYDANSHHLVEKHMPPRYIDALIVEQGATVCDLVMSKKQGGLGGYLYICGSVAVLDSVMNGIRKAIYNHRTASMDSVEMVVSKAFAERRIMLDVFMTPKPLPCNLPGITLSQLALRTGHKPDVPIWIAVHGSVYDVTEFCPMHPGGTLIIASNAGVDCTASFDNLAHTNNPEVASLLTKYFIGHLAPKPRLATDELSSLYDLWASYLRTTVETLVAHQFEMSEIMGSSLSLSSGHDAAGTDNIWLREDLPNMIAVRTFYGYQSRLLQGGFAALFGPKLQELVLKLSFSLASSAGDKLPDVLGAVARANTGRDAAACNAEVARVGQFVCDADAALRFQERGVFAYAARSVQLDIALLEGLREEACAGMDAFDALAAGEASGVDGHAQTQLLAGELLRFMERMALRLGVFYSQLAELSVYAPELERNPARTRWDRVRRQIRDGSFFVMSASTSKPVASRADGVDFDGVMAQVKGSLATSSSIGNTTPRAPMTMNALHNARGRRTEGNTTAAATAGNTQSLMAMGAFVDKNRRAIRRLSRMPDAMDLAEMQRQMNVNMTVMIPEGKIPPRVPDLPTPPSSRGSSRSPTRMLAAAAHSPGHVSAEALISKLSNARPRKLSLSRTMTYPAPYPVVGGGPSPRMGANGPSPLHTPHPYNHQFNLAHAHRSPMHNMGGQVLQPAPQLNTRKSRSGSGNSISSSASMPHSHGHGLGLSNIHEIARAGSAASSRSMSMGHVARQSSASSGGALRALKLGAIPVRASPAQVRG